MSKVIRIDDETFSRLQNLAEPLVDTPADIIGMLLNYFETATHKKEILNTNDQNLFLAPAVEENIDKTIRSSVRFSEIQKFLSSEDATKLKTKSPNENTLHCWAMTESNKAFYDSMNERDYVLFTLRNSGKFEFYGEISCKIDNEQLGKYLWGFVPGKPWKLIYFLKKLNVIDIDKTKLIEALGYKSNYNVPGIVKVKRINLETALKRYGSFENLIKSLQK